MVPLSARAAALATAAAIGFVPLGFAPIGFMGVAHAQVPAESRPAPPDPASPMAPLPDLGVAWPELGGGEAPQGAAVSPSTERRYRLRVQGLDLVDPSVRTRFDQLSALRDGEGKPANTAQIERRARQDEQLLGEALRAAGHYDADVATEVEAGAADVTVTITATPGAAYLFDRVTLTGLAPGPDADAITAAYPIRIGDTAAADRVTAALTGFRAELGRRGYPFAAAIAA